MSNLSDHQVYPAVDEESLGVHYTRHVEAMTAEGLHDKGDIAAQLAVRDSEIERLRALLGGQSHAQHTAVNFAQRFLSGEPHRKVYVCVSCHGVTPDAPLTSCDCMPDVHVFATGVIVMNEVPAQ